MLVTINSDDPPMFSTDLNNEYLIAAELLKLDRAGIAALAQNAVTASFAPDQVKAGLRAEIAELPGRAPVAMTRARVPAIWNRARSATSKPADCPAGSLALAAMLTHCQSAGPWPSVTVTVWLCPELVV